MDYKDDLPRSLTPEMISIPRQGVDPVAHAYRRTHPVEVGKITYGDIDFQTGDMDVTGKDSEKATFFAP